MRFGKRTRFKTVVLTRQKIIVCCACFAFGVVLGLVCLLLRGVSEKHQELALSDAFYKTVIQSELHQEQEEIDVGAVLEKILGFNVADAASILKKTTLIYDEPEPTPEPTPQPTPEATEQPPAEEHAIEEVQLAKGSGIELSNRTNIQVDPEQLASEPLPYALDDSGPQVLIVHTHTTESFTDAGKTKYSAEDSDRSTDETKNITAVGAAMAEVLNANGISTIQDKTVHDYPSYSGAYTRSMATVRENLEANPSIKVVLDVHRDGLVREDGTKLKVATDINGVKTAQCMFVIGSNANLTHDHWQENLKLACKLQKTALEQYPGLMRPINIREERFNQQVSMGSIIIEVGSNGNTLEEAIEGGKVMAQILTKVLKNG